MKGFVRGSCAGGACADLRFAVCGVGDGTLGSPVYVGKKIFGWFLFNCLVLAFSVSFSSWFACLECDYIAGSIYVWYSSLQGKKEKILVRKARRATWWERLKSPFPPAFAHVCRGLVETRQRQSPRSCLPLFISLDPPIKHMPTRPSHTLASTRPRTPETLERARNIRPHNRHVPDEAGNRSEEVAKQDEDAVELNEEADKGPPGEDQRDAGREGERALPLLAAREEGERFCRADYERQADEEEDLGCALGRGGPAGGR
jgi:hypothetical protein